MKRRHAMLLIGAMPIAGCALLANPTFDAVLQAAIFAVVGALLQRNPAIAGVVANDSAILAAMVQGNQTTTVAEIESQADNIIVASKLSTSDKAAMESLVAAAVGLLGQQSTQLSPKAVAGLVLVFTDMENAAKLFVTQPSSARFAIRVPMPQSTLDNIQKAAGLFGH